MISFHYDVIKNNQLEVLQEFKSKRKILKNTNALCFGNEEEPY